ncbi:hematopoietic death receptor isoform X1 [Toxotes jaculatrix]|uniref:hematopoietic death receptor isoform X1 n=1 Tax=Toxotes jaculatrix TaxID=941984 RepID=UPI001B3A8FF9|nr:hematopoietic death receptor isoform X1 [Toxotes jaculatrix]
MRSFFKLAVFSFLILVPTGAFPLSGLDSGGSKTRRDVPCITDQQYPHGSICCSYCPAGTHVKSPCTSSAEKASCEECEYGTFTEHPNGLNQCFKCTQCRPDQEMVRPCTPTQDTECRCKSGQFCAPDEACEVCKKCSRCGTDEVIVRNCTSTSNTECKKIQTSPGSASADLAAIVLPCVAVVFIALMIFAYCMRSRATETNTLHTSHYLCFDCLRNLLSGQKSEQHEERRSEQTQWPSCSNIQRVRTISSSGTEDERRELCESLNSSASNSQHSLTGLPSSASAAFAPQVVPIQPNRREEEFVRLVPVNGEESLKRCFHYFEDIDISHYKRFFRHLGINDNEIRSRPMDSYEDNIHDLLNIWVEREGREASLNDLLKALLDLNQRRTAETIMEKAVQDGHYVRES